SAARGSHTRFWAAFPEAPRGERTILSRLSRSSESRRRLISCVVPPSSADALPLRWIQPARFTVLVKGPRSFRPSLGGPSLKMLASELASARPDVVGRLTRVSELARRYRKNRIDRESNSPE